METGKMETGNVFEQAEALGHEQIVYCYDGETGLKAILGVHNTVLGPAVGGTRMWSYENEQLALRDVMRLSRGMTFKNAIAGINAGGGKAVIIGDARTQKNEALLRKFGRFINSLGGKYITAEDVGMTSGDMEFLKMETDYVSGKPDYLGGYGDPAPHTAYGTYLGMKAAAKVAFGNDSLNGKKVAIQGVGAVGELLIPYLTKENCKVFASDYYPDRLQDICKRYSVQGVELEEIYGLDVDIYAPCALGGTVNMTTLKAMKCNIIAGCANNQLEHEETDGKTCMDKGILYAPDFLINSGGVINVYSEVMGSGLSYTKAQTEKIYEQTIRVLKHAAEQQKSTHQVAMEIAMERIEKVGKLQMSR